MILKSRVKGFEGECRHTWLNKNQIYNRLDGGITGFFKSVKYFLGFPFKVGKPFHGIIIGNEVHTTEGKYR